MDENTQFTEEEAHHREHLQRQTAALESIRSYVGWLLTIVVTTIALTFVFVVGSAGIRF